VHSRARRAAPGVETSSGGVVDASAPADGRGEQVLELLAGDDIVDGHLALVPLDPPEPHEIDTDTENDTDTEVGADTDIDAGAHAEREE
jgi:hypothetical protein